MDIVTQKQLETAQAVIETDRFTLRPPRASDEGLLALYAGDKRVADATRSIPHPLPPGATRAFIDRSLAEDADQTVWILDGANQGLSEVLGVISIKPLDSEHDIRDQAEVSFWVAPSFWGTGLARTALKALVDANPLKSKVIFASIFQDNQASARVVTFAGFKYIGDAEAYSVARNTVVPTWTYICKRD